MATFVLKGSSGFSYKTSLALWLGFLSLFLLALLRRRKVDHFSIIFIVRMVGWLVSWYAFFWSVAVGIGVGTGWTVHGWGLLVRLAMLVVEIDCKHRRSKVFFGSLRLACNASVLCHFLDKDGRRPQRKCQK